MGILSLLLKSWSSSKTSRRPSENGLKRSAAPISSSAFLPGRSPLSSKRRSPRCATRSTLLPAGSSRRAGCIPAIISRRRSPNAGVRTLAYPLLDRRVRRIPRRVSAAAYQSLCLLESRAWARARSPRSFRISIRSRLNGSIACCSRSLQLDFDLVAPCYGHRPLEGLLNGASSRHSPARFTASRCNIPWGPISHSRGALLQHLVTGAQASRPTARPIARVHRGRGDLRWLRDLPGSCRRAPLSPGGLDESKLRVGPGFGTRYSPKPSIARRFGSEFAARSRHSAYSGTREMIPQTPGSGRHSPHDRIVRARLP